jgi:hypothetical protein
MKILHIPKGFKIQALGWVFFLTGTTLRSENILNWKAGYVFFICDLFVFVALITLIIGASVWIREKETKKTTNLPPPPP